MVAAIARRRGLYLAVTLTILLLGLASRSGWVERGSFIGTYSGDTLWAMMVYFGFATLLNRWRVAALALLSLAFAFTIEFSQLLHWDLLNSIRATRLGGLVLGYGFLWSDLLCYTVGIALAAALDWLLLRFHSPRR
jgi:hypothetical protein